MAKRNDRTIEQWRDAATSLSQQRYRVAATPRDILEDIVQSGSLAPDVSVGAALALSFDEGSRVRVGDDTSAVPELAAAIDAALNGDDATLERDVENETRLIDARDATSSARARRDDGNDVTAVLSISKIAVEREQARFAVELGHSNEARIGQRHRTLA